jgi:hypothetical protein
VLPGPPDEDPGLDVDFDVTHSPTTLGVGGSLPIYLQLCRPARVPGEREIQRDIPLGLHQRNQKTQPQVPAAHEQKLGR